MSKITMTGVHEWVSHDSFGRIKAADSGSHGPPEVTDNDGRICLTTAKNGYVSFRILLRGEGTYRLEALDSEPLEVDLFKAWYHTIASEDDSARYLPDALVPSAHDTEHTLPDPENEIPGQTAQEFWVDVFVPAEIEAGSYEFSIVCVSGQTRDLLEVRVGVNERSIPERPSILMDHNSYGSRWLERLYGVKSDQPDRIFALLHHYYRLVREHRGIFHNLGTSHSGSASPLYAPKVRGRADELELYDWALFDRHLGPLLSGKAFAAQAPGQPRARHDPYPLESVYTPFTPSWPASYIKWGERGYEVELTRGLRQFDRHVAEHDWLQTRYEFFFNHKKRYRWFSWDGDEVKYPEDYRFHDEMSRIFESAVSSSHAEWAYRFDASWQTEQQYHRYAGRRNFWVCGGMHRWFREAVHEVLQRDETVWWYGGLPPLDAADTAVLKAVYETWARGLTGHCLWLTVSPDDLPSGECAGNRTANIYPGERFGIEGPVPSIRLKIQRNGVQDIDLLPKGDDLRERISPEIPVEVWQERPPTAWLTGPEYWDSANLEYEHEPIHQDDSLDDTYWWSTIRRTALEATR